jgi:hypothetical protein
MAAKRNSPRKERDIRRKVGVRPVKKSFLIVCEGQNTEPDYFNSFRLTSATVKAVGKGLGTRVLVKEAVGIRQEEQRKGKTYDQYWVVFDKDDFPDEDFNLAIQEAKAEGFQVAWSNQAFEFWFILHFHLYQGPLHRSKYAEMLTKLTGMPYSKKAGVASALYNLLFPKLDTAISHAKTVLASFNEGTTPAKAESATTVFALAEQLRVYM